VGRFGYFDKPKRVAKRFFCSFAKFIFEFASELFKVIQFNCFVEWSGGFNNAVGYFG
jgi:hypothetical protein